MKRPNAAGSVLQALEPVAKKLVESYVVALNDREGFWVQLHAAAASHGVLAYLADQLHRAALSIVLNLAEGAGEFSPSEEARFYRMVLRSATECAAIIDASTALGVADGPTAALGRQQLFATVRRLSRMVQNLKTRAPRKTQRNQLG